MKTCGVTFKIWVCKTNKNKLEWTSLSGNEKKTLLRSFPAKLRAHPHSFVHEDTRLAVADLWEDFAAIYFDLISAQGEIVTESLCNELFTRASRWIEDFLKIGKKREGYSKTCVTPYMHCMAVHVPHLMLKHRGIKAHTGQGLEKANDDIKLIYFKRCNKTIAAQQTLLVRFRKSLTRKHKYVKRHYKKKNDMYWGNLRRNIKRKYKWNF